jgi:hypothetical protein
MERFGIGQVGICEYVLGQIVIGEHVWTPDHADPEAVEFFKNLWAQVLAWRQER